MSPRFSQPGGWAPSGMTRTALAPGARWTQVQPPASRVAARANGNRTGRMVVLRATGRRRVWPASREPGRSGRMAPAGDLLFRDRLAVGVHDRDRAQVERDDGR